MISPPPIADITRISIAGAALERVVNRWVLESTRGRYTLDVPTLVEAVDFYTRLLAARKTIINLSRLCSFECSNSPLVTRHSPLATPPFNDLAPLSAVGADLERIVMDWALEIEQCPDPDVPTIAEAIDIYTRLASARKTLIKLSQLTPPRPSRPNGSSHKSNPPDPAPAIDIPQLPTIPGTPYDQLRPELDFINAAFDHIGINADNVGSENVGPENVGPAPSPAIHDTPSAEDASHSSHDSHSSHNSHPSQEPPISLDARCVALNIHPALDDTSRVPNNHPWFDRSLYGHFNPRFLSSWNRKKFRRYG